MLKGEEKEWFIYVLKLEKKKWYVGVTTEVERRKKEHFVGKGSWWTKKYRPLELVYWQSLGVITDKEAVKYENVMTVKVMKKYKIANVRGGGFTQVKYTDMIHHLKGYFRRENLYFNDFF